jgi:hypothetical protein
MHEQWDSTGGKTEIEADEEPLLAYAGWFLSTWEVEKEVRRLHHDNGSWAGKKARTSMVLLETGDWGKGGRQYARSQERCLA